MTNFDVKLAELRCLRARKLAYCDWTQLPDAKLTPEQVSEWAAYRQKLRDITNNLSENFNIDDVKFPRQPS